MASCCCTNDKTDKIAVSCLGRCDLPKHHCLEKDDIRPGPVPPHMGWLYTAKDSPDFQLRCGWRPGHISCPVLRRIEANYCASRCGKCYSCVNSCGSAPCSRPCVRPCPIPRCPPVSCYPKPRCYIPCPPKPCRSRTKYCLIPCPPKRCLPAPCYPRPRCYPSPCPSRVKCFPALCGPKPRCYPSPCSSRSRSILSTCPPTSPSCFGPCDALPCSKPMVRIIRHNGQYNIITKPDNITNHPSGPFPLKYVIDTDDNGNDDKAKFSIEAKFNDQHFDYTSSQSSFVLDFSPPDNKCYKPCPRRSFVCFPCQKEDEEGLTCPKCGTKVAGKEGSELENLINDQGRPNNEEKTKNIRKIEPL